METNCTWSLISETSDLQLFYRNAENDSLKPCTYKHMKTGCHLDDIDFAAGVQFFGFSGSTKSSQIQNLFIIEPRNSVKSEPPKLDIKREGEHIFLNCSTPDFLRYNCWKYKFTYSKCDEKEQIVETEGNVFSLEYNPACKYMFQAQTVFSDYCGTRRESEMSEPVFFGMLLTFWTLITL
ncbi:interleukin-13 receptor subunit alpha-1 [Astyanax mexicanus]|nr:interleukin-13 receptor subunit alpha-1 [Astyanax mexicanus]